MNEEAEKCIKTSNSILDILIKLKKGSPEFFESIIESGDDLIRNIHYEI
jgi:hypothetical protein